MLIKENSTIPLKDPASYFESNKHNDVEPQREVFILANLTKTDVQANDAFVIGMFLYNENFFPICHSMITFVQNYKVMKINLHKSSNMEQYKVIFILI